MYRSVIFDLDGTLLNTLADLTDGVNYAMAQFGFPTHSQEAVRSFVGNGIRNLMLRAVPEPLDSPRFEEVYQTFRTYYTANCQVKTCAYDGILPLLRELRRRGISMAIVSNKNDAAVKELSAFYFEGIIETAIGGREGVPLKPAPDSVYLAMEQIGAQTGSTIYVGDSDVDKQTADNAGLSCVLVDWGFRPRQMLEKLNAMALISKPEALLSLL